MTTQEAKNSLQACIYYHYNTAPSNAIEAIYGTGRHPRYILEKTEVWNRGMTRFFAELDDVHQMKFVQLALDEYTPQLEARRGRS